MAKLLICLILMGLVLAGVFVLLYIEDRQKKRALRLQQQVRIELKNPDAAWLYSQGLSPVEIELAAARRNQLQ